MQSKALDKVKEAYKILVQWEADEAAGVAGTTDKPEAKSASEALFAARMLLQEALRLPPRNCDVGTAEEQATRLDRHCENTTCNKCPARLVPHRKGEYDDRCILKWAQTPCEAQEGAGE